MALSDNDLLDFDASTLAMADPGDARRLLHEHGDLFRAQLVAARWLDGYRLRRLANQDQLAKSLASPDWPQHERGFDEAMRDVIAHLRPGDFLPGGILHDEEIEGLNDPHPAQPSDPPDDDESPRPQSRDW